LPSARHAGKQQFGSVTLRTIVPSASFRRSTEGVNGSFRPGAAYFSGTPTIFFPLHKGADGFMSGKQFETFYWPSLRKVLLALSKEGILPVLFAEGSYNTRLGVIQDMPKGSVAWYFDQTDIVRAKKEIGDKYCIIGNVPTSLLMTGRPADVKEHCRKLIEACGKGGGYILAGGANIDEGNPENLRAVMAAAKEYGAYK
jgi:uroporphyrinogen-III decarboxylase